MEYSRFVAADAVETGLDETIEHVRAHLSSVADSDDDPNTFAEDVEVEIREADGGVLVVGTLDAEPRAFYLSPDYEPADDGEFRWENEGGGSR